MEVFYSFTVAIGLPGDASDYNEDKRLAVADLQRACKISWLSSEATMRTRSEILTIWAALKQLSEDKNDAMYVVLLRLIKTKYFNMVPSFCRHWHLA